MSAVMSPLAAAAAAAPRVSESQLPEPFQEVRKYVSICCHFLV